MNKKQLPVSEFQRMTLRYVLYLMKHAISSEISYIYVSFTKNEINAINELYNDLAPMEDKEELTV